METSPKRAEERMPGGTVQGCSAKEEPLAGRRGKGVKRGEASTSEGRVSAGAMQRRERLVEKEPGRVFDIGGG